MTRPAIRLTEVQRAAGSPADPLIVLGHSLGTGTLIWEDVVPALAAEYRVALLTLPGHEGTPAPEAPFTLAELADAVAAEGHELAGSTGRFFYAGVSIGGALALELALHHPGQVLGSAVVASGAYLGGPDTWVDRARLVREQSPASLVDRSSRVWFGPDAFVDRQVMVGRILRVLQETSSEGYVRCAEALAEYDLRGELERIEVPVLALWGEHDTVGTEEMQDEIVSRVRHARKVMVAGAAHQPPAEKPEATAAALLEFFGGLR